MSGDPADYEGEPKKQQPSKNTIFTEDAAAKARELLKKKLGPGTLRSGIDPEILQAGITLAGYHIEKGARTFAAYAAAMVDDLGDAVKPYLKSWYMGVKYDPRASEFDGMDSAATVEAADLDSIAQPPEQAENRRDDAARQLDSDGEGTLEGAPSGDVLAPQEDGQARTGAEGRGERDGEGNAGTPVRRVRAPRGMGSGEGEAPATAKRTRKRRGTAADGGVQGDAGLDPIPGLFENAGGERLAPSAPAIETPQFDPQDFTIEEDFALGEGGQKTKYRANVDAIRLLKQLEAEGRQATRGEQEILARYVGWGGISQAFDESNDSWRKEYAELRDVLTEDEYDAARQSTQYAHYTSREIIGGMYYAMQRFGFTGGRMLEGGGGVGNFIGLMPIGMRSASRFTLVERDRIAAGIAKHLYPKHNVQSADFTEFKGDDGFFDASVGNPPFGSTTLVDQSGRKHLSGLSIHNYFFAKDVDMLREGGILAQVVSNSFLDAKTDKARKYISDRVVFLGAIRLPNNAFAKNANTEVTTDIIFLQKRPEAEWGSKAAKEDAKRWIDTVPVKDPNGGDDIALNRYFAENPGMMLGKFGRYGTMYGPGQPALVAREGQDTAALLRAAIEKLPENVYTPAAVAGTEALKDQTIVALGDDTVAEGGHYIKDGKLYQRLSDVAGETRAVEITPETQWTEKTKLGEAGFARLSALADMRKTMRSLLAAELSGDKDMDALRAKLNEQYDAYAKSFGLINDRATARVFDDDPDFPLLAALELDYTPGIGAAAAKSMGIKPTKSTAKKAPIFRQRVVDARVQVRKAESPSDALSISMAERGRLDEAYIGELLGRSPDGVLEELSSGAKPLLFRDPDTNEYVLRDEYLSGNVRKKLAIARQAGMMGNVRALEEVQPEDVGAHEIAVKLGSPWVPTPIYEDFAAELLGEGTRATVNYIPINSSYLVSITPGSETANTNTWGTNDYEATALLSAILNNRDIKVVRRDSDGNSYTDMAATEAANTKAADIKNRFQDWLFADTDRSEILVRAYNDTNNNYVVRTYDGSWMRFPGKVPDSIIKFRRHQRNAIARIVQDRTSLLDHVVGAGKTFTVIAGAMELKRTGLARKPMVVVPNHLVKQWAADFYRLYPGANILTATKKDFERANRRRFLAKIATGDWDAVVMAHSSFGFIKPAPDFEAEFNEMQVAKVVQTIQAVENSDGDKRSKKRTVKQLEALKERLENRIKALRDKAMDDLLDFEQIGVDQLFVDEAHLFKNLMFTTKMQNVRGLGDSAGSQRAYDMFVKVNQLYAKNGRGQGVVFATGTPVSNSLAEMYHMMRYLMPAQMEEMGFQSFDAWANTFASVEQVWMQKPSGDGFKAQNRMSRFSNTAELLRVFDQVSDTVTMDDIKAAFKEENGGKEFPLPALKTGRRQPVSLDKSEAQESYMQSLAQRAKRLEERRGPPQKGEDNSLVIMSDGRKAAMDIRLVDQTITQREKGGRIDRAADEIFARYKKYADVRGTQLVFSDLGTPLTSAKAELKEYQELKDRADVAEDQEVQTLAAIGDEAALKKLEDAEAAQAELDAKGSDWLGAVQAAMRGFSVYDDLKAALVERGIPESEVAFIHSFNTDEQKAGLFRKVNAGDIRVVLGSTAKMGAGTNVQERLVALHHLDVPWKPSDVEQREGRIIRQGNSLMGKIKDFEVEILAYVTKDTLDMRMWQIQETKLQMINQLRTRKIGREIDNVFEEMEMSAGEMQAAATGNMDLLREIQLRADVKKLEQQLRSFNAQKSDLQSRKRRAEHQVSSLPREIEQAKDMRDAAREYTDAIARDHAAFQVTIDGKEYTNTDAAEEALRALVDAKDEEGKPKKISVEFNGKTYGSREALADAYADVRGDRRDPIRFEFGGQVFNRRPRAAAAIASEVADSAATDTEREVGALGPFKVTVEGFRDRMRQQHMSVTVAARGQESSTTVPVTTNGKPEDNARRTAENVIKAASAQVVGMGQRVEYLEHSLDRAKKTLAEIEKAPVAGEWPHQDKLDKARAEHREILARLSDEPAEEGPTDEPAFSRGGRGGGRGMSTAEVSRIADAVRKAWANGPDVVVAADMADPSIPAAVRRADAELRSNGATGEPEGFFYGGKVYLVAGALDSPADVVRVLAHESLGHYGLRGLFGDRLMGILAQVANARPREVTAKMREYGLSGAKGRLQAAEEVLAVFAQTNPKLGFVKRAIAAIRSWLRGLGVNLRMSDNDIIAQFIIPARAWVQRGGKAGTGMPAFSNPDIRFSRAAQIMGQRQKIVDGIADLYKSSKGFNWWHKTLGTQYEKADRNPYFRRAFEAAQSFLNDVSDFANRAADLAPSLLPKMNGIRDVLKRPVPKKDVDAIARPIFDGTLYDSDPAKGKVWSDDELRDTYGLNQKQIDLYREFRAAVDKSLDDMGKTDLIRYVGKDADPVRDQVREASSISAAAEILAAHLEQLAQDNPKGSHAETAATVRKKAERIEGLKAGGYAPLMRFGRFSVYVTRQDEDGAPEQVYFGMFETQREANRMARQFRDDPTYADAEVTQGVMSQEAFKLFQGVNPDTLELFADVAGIEQTELFQTYLKLAKSNRSAMKRLINRKGVAGFSDDVTRVLASFITSNSRAAAANMNVSEMNAAASEVPKEQGDVKDEAVRLVEFVRGTNDPSSKLRGLLFMQYLGGSVASALVNMTQPLTMTYPYLAQFSGAAKAGAILTKAVKDAVTGVGSDRDLSRALKQAESEGIVSPQEIHHLYSEAGIGLGRNTAIRRATFAWGAMFSAAEQFNRRATFIAAYRIAREQGISDPYKFAEKAVVETQGVYSRANRANWARNPVGATLLTFKQFMIAYLEFLKRLPPKERALAMAVLILVAGLEELPFADDAEDVVDTVAQALGYNWNTARAKREWLAGLLGQQGSEFVLNGLSAVHGMPIDVSARLGLGNLIPGTGLLLGSTRDKSREITEVLGAGGSFAQSVLDAGGALLSGDVRKAGEAVAPLAVRNALKGIDMYQTGMYRDTKGRRVMDVDGYDALVKAIGLQPAEVAAKQRKASIVYESVALVKNVEGRIAERWARGVFERDAEAIKAARDELRAWNRTNPEARISIEQSQINRRVRAMRATRAERLAGTAPREIRQAVKESL